MRVDNFVLKFEEFKISKAMTKPSGYIEIGRFDIDENNIMHNKEYIVDNIISIYTKLNAKTHILYYYQLMEMR